ncbi:hypothetical protein QYF61_001337 [Mycteria americana]|uniref:HSF-type DNA-binding domain-containing protein n=1 Tax=Mycteria americana TaxID=33587 RepID=A0AAN7MM80_MYCAM|nr:hypothetical protein QYF61_001337 [Mycteria americana]
MTEAALLNSQSGGYSTAEGDGRHAVMSLRCNTDVTVTLRTSQAAGTMALHPADQQDQAWLAGERAMAGSCSQAVKKVVKMEPPSPGTSWALDLQEPDWWAASTSPDHAEGDTGTSWGAATGPLAEEKAFQGLPDESWVPIMRYHFWEEISANTNQPSARSFLQKLWKIVSSHRFQSIWWGDDGNCVVIAEKLFRTEVLGRRGPLKIFETESMRGFVLQLNLHGFCKMEGDSLISASVEELQAIAAAGPALGKLLFYYNPFFKRDDPSLLRMVTPSAGERKTAPAPSPLGAKLKEDHPRRRRPEARPAVGDAEDENDPQTSATTGSTPPEPRADAAARTGSAGPSPPKRHRSHGPAGTQEAAPAPSTASPRRAPQTVPSRQPRDSPHFHPGSQI